MTATDWQRVYRDAWDLYHSADHTEAIFRRAKACGVKPVHLLNHILQFYFTFIQENVLPLQSGYFRRKLRPQRRFRPYVYLRASVQMTVFASADALIF